MIQKRTSQIQVISRACGLLGLFSRQKPEMSLSELAKQAGLHPTTAYRIIQQLVVEGMLARDHSNNKYRLGPNLLRLGEIAKATNDLIRIAYPHVAKLAARWEETTIIDTLDHNLRIASILSIPSTHRIATNPDYNKPLLPHCLAAGKLLFAYLPPERVDEFLTQELVALTEKTITDPDVFRKELNKIREQGYSTNLGEQEIGFNAVAAPIREASGQVVAALSVGGPSSRLRQKKLREVIHSVVAVARSISNDLGHGTDASTRRDFKQLSSGLENRVENGERVASTTERRSKVSRSVT
jgi:DNA-binding IclR family transcriptional regulator